MRGYRVMVILAVVCALAAAFFSVRTIQTYVGQVKVIAAAKDLGADQVIAPKDLQWISYPKGALYRDTVVNPIQAEGYVARGFIPAGTVLRQSMLARGAVATIPGILAQLSQSGSEYCAMAFPDSIYTTVGGQVHSGDHMDVYLTNSSTPVATNVMVLVGISVVSSNGQSAPQGIVLALTPQEQTALLPYVAGHSKARATLVFVLLPPKEGR